MKARWRDGLRLFRRDSTIKFRGIMGRGISDVDGYNDRLIPGPSARGFVKRKVHKKSRQEGKIQIQQVLGLGIIG